MTSRQQTREEILATYIDKMGRELGELFDAISAELTQMHWRWQQYRSLFGIKPGRIDILNATAPCFFRIVHDVLFENTILAIARLVSSPKSVGKDNLTIQRLPSLLNDPKLGDGISMRIAKAKTSAAFAVEWRNRHIAHRDLDLLLSSKTKMLEAATSRKVEQALSNLREVLDEIELFYCDTHTAYGFAPPWGADDLIYVLRDGLAAPRPCDHLVTQAV